MICEDKKLIERSKTYFEANKDLKELFVTDDGQFFYTENASSFHCQQNGVKVFQVTREMSLGKKKEAPKVEDKKEELPTAKKTTSKTKKSVKDG